MNFPRLSWRNQDRCIGLYLSVVPLWNRSPAACASTMSYKGGDFDQGTLRGTEGGRIPHKDGFSRVVLAVQ